MEWIYFPTETKAYRVSTWDKHQHSHTQNKYIGVIYISWGLVKTNWKEYPCSLPVFSAGTIWLDASDNRQ